MYFCHQIRQNGYQMKALGVPKAAVKEKANTFLKKKKFQKKVIDNPIFLPYYLGDPSVFFPKFGTDSRIGKINNLAEETLFCNDV